MTKSGLCVTDGLAMGPLVLVLLLLFGCSQGGPLPERVGGMKGLEVRRFEGGRLFDYMDGGAELYYEYGFRCLWVRDYRSEEGELRAELSRAARAKAVEEHDWSIIADKVERVYFEAVEEAGS